MASTTFDRTLLYGFWLPLLTAVLGAIGYEATIRDYTSVGKLAIKPAVAGMTVIPPAELAVIKGLLTDPAAKARVIEDLKANHPRARASEVRVEIAPMTGVPIISLIAFGRESHYTQHYLDALMADCVEHFPGTSVQVAPDGLMELKPATQPVSAQPVTSYLYGGVFGGAVGLALLLAVALFAGRNSSA